MNPNTTVDVVDLEEIVKRHGWALFDETKTCKQALIPKKSLRMNVDWKRVKVQYDSPAYKMDPPIEEILDILKSSKSQIVFKTTFTNSTEQEQEYSFKTDRITKSIFSVSVEKGFKAGMELGFHFQIPGGITKISAGFKPEITLKNTEQDTIEEELTWGVDNKVKVPAGMETVAELVVQEAQSSGSFEIKCHLEGEVGFTWRNTKKNNSFVTEINKNIALIIQNEKKNGKLPGFIVEGTKVVADVSGKCKFKPGIEQKVHIHEQKLNN